MPAVRTAVADDAPEVARIFAEGFSDDPVFSWVFTEARRTAKLQTMFSLLVEDRYIPAGTTSLADGAAAAWLPPSPPEWSEEQSARFLHELVPQCTADELGRLAVLGLVTEQHHPTDPHWYLGIIAVDPAQRGRGRGTQLLAETLRQVDADGCPAFLESSNPRNNPLYERHGFEVMDEIVLDGGPSLWAMWREPRLPG